MMTLSRRRLLSGLGAAGAYLPILKSIPAYAQTGNFGKRFIFIVTPNGTLPSKWLVSGGETGFTFPAGSVMESLNPFVSDLVAIQGLDNKNPQSSGHPWAFPSLVSGVQAFRGKTQTSGGISIDQAIANKVGSGTPFQSLQFGVNSKYGFGQDAKSYMSYKGSDQPNPNERDPYQAFQRLFVDRGIKPANGGSAPIVGGATVVQEGKHLKFMRKAVLDNVRHETNALKRYLDSTGREQLDAHLTSVTELEKELFPAGGDTVIAPIPGMGCGAPAANPKGIGMDDEEKKAELSKLQIDNIVAAFACGLTRVMTLQFGIANGYHRYGFLGVSGMHHELAHATGNADADAGLLKINRFYAEQLAYLLKRMKEIPEGSGSMLDNSVVLFGHEHSLGSHSCKGLKFILAGKAGGSLKTGRSLVYSGDSHQNLLTSAANLVGADMKTFGDPKLCTGPLSRLT